MLTYILYFYIISLFIIFMYIVYIKNTFTIIFCYLTKKHRRFDEKAIVANRLNAEYIRMQRICRCGAKR